MKFTAHSRENWTSWPIPEGYTLATYLPRSGLGLSPVHSSENWQWLVKITWAAFKTRNPEISVAEYINLSILNVREKWVLLISCQHSFEQFFKTQPPSNLFLFCSQQWSPRLPQGCSSSQQVRKKRQCKGCASFLTFFSCKVHMSPLLVFHWQGHWHGHT